jgi:hypothetical protein
MKNLQNVRYAIAAVATVAAVAAFAPKADAQTQAFTSTITVSNALTLDRVNNLNFGTLAVARGASATASIVLGPDGTLGTPSTTGTPAYIAVVDNADVTAAEVNVSGGANGANINVNIPVASIVAPISGLNAFALGTWMYTWNAGAATAIVPGTPQVVQFDSAQAGGLNNLKIGATLTTTNGAAAYADAAYAGSFNVVFSY